MLHLNQITFDQFDTYSGSLWLQILTKVFIGPHLALNDSSLPKKTTESLKYPFGPCLKSFRNILGYILVQKGLTQILYLGGYYFNVNCLLKSDSNEFHIWYNCLPGYITVHNKVYRQIGHFI